MLAEKLDHDLKEAARARDQRRLSTLRMLRSAGQYREIELGHALSDEEWVGVVQTLVKQRKDSQAQYVAGGRPELAGKEGEEIDILQAYLPRQLTDDELAALVQEAIASSGAKGPREMGAVMKALMPRVQGKAEGKRVSDAVKTALSRLGA